MNQGYVIAIDGPAAAGKGTIVQLLATHFQGINIYTGGMYRALALACIRSGVSLADVSGVEEVLKRVHIELDEGEGLSTTAAIYLDGEDVTSAIRTPEVGLGAGKVSPMQAVRDVMVARQHEIAERFVKEGKVVIIDGQDIATFVYPEAKIKIFLTASQSERASRRRKQYEKQGIHPTSEEMLAEIVERDTNDFNREVNPLSKDYEKDRYFYVDSSGIDEHKTIEIILEYINNHE